MHTGPGTESCRPRPRALHAAGRGGCHPGDTLNRGLPPLKARRARAASFVPCGTAGRAMPRHRPGVAAAAVTVASGDRRDTRAEWGRGGPRRSARTPEATALRARAGAPRPRRHTKMSAGEKINPCVAAAALPLRSSLLSRPRVPRRRRRRRQRRGRRFFLKRPHQTLGSAPLQAGRSKGPGARLPGRPGRPGGGFATAAPGLRPDIPL